MAVRKTALITGASRGLGRSMALHLAERGVDIIGTFHSKEAEANEVLAEIEDLGAQAAFLRLDTSLTETFSAFATAVSSTLAEKFGQDSFDYLVNNAGIGINAPFAETSEAQFDQLLAIHLKGPFFLTQSLLPLIADGGRIVNISTGLTRFSVPGYAAYASAKGGVEVMTRYLAKELGPRRISVNTIAPGVIETDFAGGAVRDNAELNQTLASTIALGRTGLPDDIGTIVSALLSDGCGWINGQRVEASGGQNL